MKIGENRKIGRKALSSGHLTPATSSKSTPNPHGRNGIKISLAPYSFEDALKKILKAEPPPKAEKKPAKKSPRKK